MKKKGDRNEKKVGDSNQKGILGKPNYTFQRKLTPKEMDEHRAQNLCYFCHGKYAPGHECPQRKKLQVFLMEVEEDEHSPQDDEDDSVTTTESLGEGPTVSLNAIHGET